MQKVYDSALGKIVDFIPIEENKISIYVCGPTVQSGPHLGHLRSALVYDLMKSWFEYSGYEVTLIRNVTDIEDKVLVNAEKVGVDWRYLAYSVEQEFNRAYDFLGIKKPDYEPRATGSMHVIIGFISKLIQKEYAYFASDGSANVYFDVTKFPYYGELTRQKIEDLDYSTDGDVSAKRNKQDFTLWKAKKNNEPNSASWDSPWGLGRPGWHIECSAMSYQYLGKSFDIHGGGLDLRFPHHENELAQSKSLGYNFAKYWLHNGLINFSGQKMSKSLGNIVTFTDIAEKNNPQVLRYFLLSAHYRSELDFNESSLAEAASAYGRILSFLNRAEKVLEINNDSFNNLAYKALPAYEEAMLNDFSTPQAIAAIHDAIKIGNSLIAKNDAESLFGIYSQIRASANNLGLIPKVDSTGEDALKYQNALDKVIDYVLTQRNSYRLAKDYANSDKIRDLLVEAGIVVSDSQDGTQWSLDG